MLLEEKYIFFDVTADDKEELLKFISKQALELGITNNQEGLLEDLKKRESEFPTGLQDGFAIPHARSEHVQKPSILYLKTTNALEWGSMDDNKINYIFSLLVPAQNEGNMHLAMLSKLATCLLEDDFKDYVKSATDKKELQDYLCKNMEEE